jgi:nuclease-like protein/schlafen family protein/UvrD-like helicase family protein
MATMFPARIPDEILSDRTRSSEIEVYKALDKQLDNSWHVFYSSPWLGTTPSGDEIDGEADFIVAHREKGYLSIEVKGGRVEIDSNGNWTSTDRHEITRTIKNPVKQARDSKHNILKKLKESTYWPGHFIRIRHGVILNHVDRPARDLRPDMPLNIFAFHEDLKNLESWINSRFGDEEADDDKVKPFGNDGLYALDDLIARPVRLNIKLGTTVEHDLKEIKLKTDDQIFILKELEDNNRMTITGAAGTGKTILALEKATSLADAGRKVLLLCYNTPLTLLLKKLVSQYPLIRASNFDRFCKETAASAKINTEHLSYEQLQDGLVDNFIKANNDQFDALVIDEGQDFQDKWLRDLEITVKDKNDGTLYIFYDDNQNLMSTSADYISGLPSARHRLTRNFRNTKSIFEKAKRFYAGGYVKAIGPDGKRPVINTYTSILDLRTKMGERTGVLCKGEQIYPGDIAALVPDSNFLNNLYDGGDVRLGRYQVTNAENPERDKPVLDTIRRFKGLERPVVILVMTSGLLNQSELFYTGITRAQSILEIFVPPHLVNVISSDE